MGYTSGGRSLGNTNDWFFKEYTLIGGCTTIKTMLPTAALGIKRISRFVEKTMRPAADVDSRDKFFATFRQQGGPEIIGAHKYAQQQYGRLISFGTLFELTVFVNKKKEKGNSDCRFFA
jgi:hypothetical protein